MKTKGIIKLFPGLASMFLSGALSASTIWMPTDGDLNIFDFSYGASGLDFAIFDDSNLALDDSLGYLPLAMFDKVELQASGADWNITNSGGDGFTLTDSDQFLLAAYDGVNWSSDVSITVLGGANAYEVEFYNGYSLILNDAVPSAVPVPAAVWLFGSGLTGLIAMSRRKRLSKQ